MVWGRPQFAAYKLACLANCPLPDRVPSVFVHGLAGLLYRLFLLYGSQTPGYLQKQPCHLPEETGVQLLCAASYDIWCRDLDTDQTSTEQTCGPHRPKWKEVCSTSHRRISGSERERERGKSHRRNQQCGKN